MSGVELQMPAADDVERLKHQGVFHIRVINKLLHRRIKHFHVLVHAETDAGGINADIGHVVLLRQLLDGLGLRARSAYFRQTLNTKREKSWHQTSVGEVVKEIAGRHKLKTAVSDDVAKMTLNHIDQTNESDASFLMRLAKQCGAVACIKDGNLLFIRQEQGKTASGNVLPAITLVRKDGDGHPFMLADCDAYTGVIASWLHTREPDKKAEAKVKRRRRKPAAQKNETEAKQGDYLIDTDENVLVLSRTYANRANAERAAKMQ
jgi:uncharacterized protein